MRCTNCGEDIALGDDLETIIDPLTFLCIACDLDEDDDLDFYDSVCDICGGTFSHRIDCTRRIDSSILHENKT